MMNYFSGVSLPVIKRPEEFLVPKFIVIVNSQSDSFNKGAEYCKIPDYYSALKEFRLSISLGLVVAESLVNEGFCLLNLGQIKECILSFKKSREFSSTEISYYNAAIACIYDHDFIGALKTINSYSGRESKDYLILKRFIYSRNKLTFPYVLKKIKENRSISSDIVDKKTNYFSTKSTVQLKKPSEKDAYKLYSKVPSYDSRIFRANSITPELTKIVNSQKNEKKRKRRKMVYSFSPKKLMISNKTPTPDMYYGKFSNKNKFAVHTRREKESEPLMFIQESISSINKTIEVNKFQREFSCKMSQFYENDAKEISDISNCYFYNPKDLEANYVTKQEACEILSEYSRPKSIRNYSILDSLTMKNIFFSRFHKEIRIALLKESTPIEFASGDIIFREGDLGDDMYAIVRGSIVLEKVSQECRNEVIPVASLYDGRYFGELSLASEEVQDIKGTRTATCVVTENTLVFAIPKIKYNQILLQQLEHDLDKKIIFLSQVEIFKNIDPYVLIPLATNMEIITYQNNQIILGKNMVPNGVYIIVKGFAIAIAEGIKIKQRPTEKAQEYLNGAIKLSSKMRSAAKEKYLNHKKIEATEAKINELIFTANSNTWKKLIENICNEEKHLMEEDRYFANERVKFSVLKAKDYFGCRALYMTSEDSAVQVPPAKFTIVTITQVAESETVEVFLLKPFHLTFLTEKVQQHVLAKLKNSYEIDCPPNVDLASIDSFFKEWSKYKQNFISEIRQRALLEKEEFKLINAFS